jgi:hypothetical protein
VVLLVLVLYSFLIISCFISNKEIFSSPWYFSAYKMVSSPYKWYNSFNQNANSTYYWETILLQRKICTKKHIFLFCFVMGKVLMIWTLQWFHWHEQHMLKVDPNFSIAHPSHLLSHFYFYLNFLTNSKIVAKLNNLISNST